MFVLPIFIVFALAGLNTEKTLLQQFFSSKIMLLLGNASFAFYLVNISYVHIRLRWIWLRPDRNFVLLWLIAIVLYLFFEKPYIQ
jgi:peptidoglycan/LPS O-acetylase OafA/YrhL